MLRFKSFRDLELLLRVPSESSSVMETVVAAVAVEFDLRENFVRLSSPVLVVCVYIDDLLVVDLDRLRPLTDPLKMSPMDEPCFEPKRLREMTSKPNIDARDALLAVGVDGNEFPPVRHLNKPNCWTVFRL